MKIGIFRLSFIFLFFNFLKSDITLNLEEKVVSGNEFNKDFIYFKGDLESKNKISNFLDLMVSQILKNSKIIFSENEKVQEYLVKNLKDMIFPILDSKESVKLDKSNYLKSGFKFEKKNDIGVNSVIHFLVEDKSPLIRFYENIVKNEFCNTGNFQRTNLSSFNYNSSSSFINKNLTEFILKNFKAAGLDFSKIFYFYHDKTHDLNVNNIFKLNGGDSDNYFAEKDIEYIKDTLIRTEKRSGIYSEESCSSFGIKKEYINGPSFFLEMKVC